MSFDKYMGKDKRRQYRGAKAIDRTCRNHGSCLHCKGNRLHNASKKKAMAEQSIRDYYYEENNEVII